MRRLLRISRQGLMYARTWLHVRQQGTPYQWQVAIPPTLPEDFPLFILAGQSNMAGQAEVLPADMQPLEQVLCLHPVKGWVNAREPMHRARLQPLGTGPGRFFGMEMHKKWPNKTIGLIPCAAGGSPLQAWWSDAPYRGIKLYSRLLAQVATARKTGTLAGVLWHQGESNATTQNYPEFAELLPKFFTRLRADLQQPEVPIFMGEIGNWLPPEHFPYRTEVNEILHQTTKDLSHTHLIKTHDLTHMGDRVHFDRASMQAMGKRYAEAVWQHIQS